MKTPPPIFQSACLGLLMALTASGQTVQLLSDINTAPLTASAGADEMVVAGKTMFIATDNAVSGAELWKFNVQALFQNPQAVTADSAGNVYVADTSNHVIRKITPNGVVTTLAGVVGVSGSADGSGLSARFNSPQGIAVVTSGTNQGVLYVADTGNHTIRRISVDGTVTTPAGDAGVQGDASGAGANSRFRSPQGIAVNETGSEVYIADTGNHTIRRLQISGVTVTSLLVAGLSQNPGANDGTGNGAKFNAPQGVTVVTTGVNGGILYVADTGNHTIRKILNGTVSTIAGLAGTTGNQNGTTSASRFNAPEGIATDASGANVYVCDTANHLIRRIVITPAVNVTTLAGSGVSGAADGIGTAASFKGPQGLGLANSQLYVADTSSHTIRNIGSITGASGVVNRFAGQTDTSGNLDGSALTSGTTGVPELVRDINPGINDSGVKYLTVVGTNVFFSAEDAGGERDLWFSDGTQAGTKRVGGTNYSGSPDGPENLVNVNGTLFYQGYGATQGAELWRATVSGTTVTPILVKDINPTGSETSSIRNLFSADSTNSRALLFTAYDGEDPDNNPVTPSTGLELWMSFALSGTPDSSKTIRISDLLPGAADSEPAGFRFFSGSYFFSASGIDSESSPIGRELFKTTLNTVGGNVTATTALVEDISLGGAGSNPQNLVVSGPVDITQNGQLFFTAATDTEGRELWAINSTNGLANPQMVRNLNNSSQDSGIANLTAITVTEGNPVQSNWVIFSADADNNLGNELYVSDGSQIGTGILKDITPGAEGSDLGNFQKISGGLVIFTKKALDETITLWKTDGTQSGTVEIEDFATESSLAKSFRSPAKIGANLYFMLGDDELWRTDGQSDDGTVLVHRFRTTTGSSLAQDFTRLSDGKVVFSAVTSAEGREPWVSDLAGNTVALADLFVGPDDSDPQDFTPTDDGRVFFTALDSENNRELYLYDGVSTNLVKEINAVEGCNPKDLFWHGVQLYFSASSLGSNDELWVSDGTSAGTVLLKDINPAEGSNPANFVSIGTAVYFAASTSTSGLELWKTDGTAVGTLLVKDISSIGTSGSDPSELVVMPSSGSASRVFFVATGSANGPPPNLNNSGREIWKSDGTTSGTGVVKDIISGNGSSILDSESAYLTVVGNTLFFVADDGVKGKELWMSTGATGNATLVKDINTQIDFGMNTQGSDPTQLRSVNGKLFFLADDGLSGRELWVSNGTAAGTVRVKDIIAGTGDAGIQEMTVAGDVLCFTADDGLNGREVWISDGTAAGTLLMAETLPGATSSAPHSLAFTGGTLLFSALDSVVGDEPRSVVLAAKLVIEQPADTALISGSSTVNFTPVPLSFGGKADLVFKLKNEGINGVRNITPVLSGVHAADFIITKKPATTILKSGFSEMTVQFKPKEGGARSAILTIISTDPNTPNFTINLAGSCTKDPTVGLQPISQMVKVGTPVAMTSNAVSGTAPITLQWRKNAAAIAGATSNPLYLWAAKITDSGAYTAQFKSSTTPAAGLGTSDIAQLGVVEDYIPARIAALKVGLGTTLTVNTGGNNLTYAWKRSFSSDLSSPQTLAFKGATTKTLTIANAQPTDPAYYFCEVTGPGGTVVGGTTYLKVFNNPPEVTPAQTLPVGVVGANYFYQVSVNVDPSRAPTTFSAKTLPAGLKIDAKTGIISGVPTKAGSTTVTLGATNGYTPLPTGVDATLTVVELPSGLDGVFQGLVEREQEINSMAGGRIEITVSKTGSYTGKLTVASTLYSFKGNLSFGIDGTPAAIPPFTSTVRIPRAGIASPLDLTFTINPTTKDIFSSALITSINSSGPVSAGVTGWKANTNTARYVGLYNFGIGLVTPGTSNDVPQGDGYASFTVAAKGTLSIAGKTADGESITCATHVGPSGQVLLYQSLYTTTRKGSIAGQFTVDTGSVLDSPTDNTIIGSTDFDWVRPPATLALSTATNTRTYRLGFGLADTPVVDPVELEAFGGFYQPGAHLLQIGAGSTTLDNASLAFTEAGVNLPTREPDLPSLAVNLSAVKVLTPSTALTKITAVLKTGIFNGSFALADDDITTTTPAALNNKADELKRTVNFLGLIVPEAGNHRGVGYFMLPQIPPTSGATPAKTALILSGKVNFDN